MARGSACPPNPVNHAGFASTTHCFTTVANHFGFMMVMIVVMIVVVMVMRRAQVAEIVEVGATTRVELDIVMDLAPLGRNIAPGRLASGL